MDYYAHSSEEREWQLLKYHLYNTAMLASQNASKFEASLYGYYAGLFHDIGKYQASFQGRLKGAKHRVDHSTVGGKELLSLYYHNPFSQIIAYCILGHHSGLPDYGHVTDSVEKDSLLSRLNKEFEDYSNYQKEIGTYVTKDNFPVPIKYFNKDYPFFSLSCLIRMVFSCLTDADFIDTEKYYNSTIDRNISTTIECLDSLFNKKLIEFKDSPKTLINIERMKILNNCIELGKSEQGFYQLTVPTGGGKTISSLAFALEHMKKHQLDRVIYVIPYTSIIEQTAQIFKTIFGNDLVLEHHYNYSYLQENLGEKAKQKLKLSSENWDAPIVVTTNVQFFESLFSSKSSKARKLHNITRSVIIFDEVQMFPIDYLKPNLLFLNELVKNYHSTIVLCTATQPNFDNLLPSDTTQRNIIKDEDIDLAVFNRTTIINLGDLNDDDLIKRINQESQCLTILNTRKHAYEVFKNINHPYKFHLSTLMTPNHRRSTLSKIKQLLSENKPCIVISTQLIEAGVDIDFKVVYRSMSGIDSIAQSAGRCNREGKNKQGNVYVFNSLSPHDVKKGFLSTTKKLGQYIVNKHDNPLSKQAISEYFTELYKLKESELDKKEILKLFRMKDNKLVCDFKKCDLSYKIIETEMFEIIINNNSDVNLTLNNLQFVDHSISLKRSLQPYTVGIYEYEYQKLLNQGLVKVINDTYLVLTNNDYYDKDTGLAIPDNQDNLDLLFI